MSVPALVLQASRTAAEASEAGAETVRAGSACYDRRRPFVLG